MSEEDKKVEEKKEDGKPQDITPENAVFLVPLPLLQAVATYLSKRPYEEVAQLLSALTRIPAQDRRELIPKE